MTSALRTNGTVSGKRELEILAIVVALDYELKTIVLRLVESPGDRALWQKYLALTSWQIFFGLPKLLGADLKAEGKALNSAVKEIRGDEIFINELVRIRNGVVAHLSLVDDLPGRVEWSFDSILSEQAREPAVLSPLVARALTLSHAVHQLGSTLLLKHPLLFPDAKL